jgi:hypothetical protein
MVLPKFVVICLVSGAVYLAASRVLKLSEVEPVISSLKRIILAQPKPKKR